MKKKTEINNKSYYRTTVTIGYDDNGKQIQKTFYGKTKKEAEKKKNDYLNDIKNGINVDYKNARLKDIMKFWLFEVAKLKLSGNSFARYEVVYRLYLLESTLANVKISDVNSILVQKEYNALHEQGKSENIIKSLNKLLRSFFNYAIVQGFIIKNPCFKLVIPKDKNNNIDSDNVDPFTNEEIKSILENSSQYFCIFSLAFASGMRSGELRGLRFCDIDMKNKEIKVLQSVKQIKNIKKESEDYQYETVLEPPKTPSAIRNIPIPDSIIPLLEKHSKEQKERILRNGLSFKDDCLFFTTENYIVIDSRNFIRAWERTLKRANVRYRKLHNTRHTYATKLFEAGVPLLTISKLLGHAKVSITADIYTHIQPRQKIEAVNNLNFLFENN